MMIELFNNFAENSRNSDQQSAFEVAQSNEDLEAVCLMYDYLLEKRAKKIAKNKERAKNFLSKQPNFYLEMKWEVNVKVPLVSYFCPNDICKIWKYDQNVRMDYSFVEFKNLSSVRCPSSWYFLGGFKKSTDQSNFIRELTTSNQQITNELKTNNLQSNEKKNFEILPNNIFLNENEQSVIFQANWKKNTYFNPFEEFDESEKELIIKDIMNSHRIHGEFKLKNCIINESVGGWSKKPIIEKINGWNAKKYEVSLTAFVNLHNKEKFFYEDFIKEDYFDSEKPLHKKIIYVEDKESTKKNIADGFKVKNDKMRNALMKISDNKDKKLKAYVWIVDNFPIKSSVFIILN
jgi:GPCR-chaperone